MTPLDAARAALEAAAKVCESAANEERIVMYDMTERLDDRWDANIAVVTLTNAAASIRAIDPAEVVNGVAKKP